MSRKKASLPLSSDVVDAWAIYHNTPWIKIARNTFIGKVLVTPPRVTVRGIEESMTDEFAYDMETHWVKWLSDVYDWEKAIGVCPWYLHREGDLYFPVVPAFEAGRIQTYLTKKGRQKFEWYWTTGDQHKPQASQEPARNVFFYAGAHAPSPAGALRSVVSTLIADWRSINVLREASEIAWTQQSHQQHLLEFHPPRNNMADDNLTTLEAFGDEIANTVMHRQEAFARNRMAVRTTNLAQALAQTLMHNSQARLSLLERSSNNETAAHQSKRVNANSVERAVRLEPDFHYKSVPAPTVHGDLTKLQQAYDHKAAAIMDFPIQLIEAPGGFARGVANLQGNRQFINDRINAWVKTFKHLIRQAFVEAYRVDVTGELVRRGKRKHPEDFVKLHDIEVEIASAPEADFHQLQREGYMNKKRAGERMFEQIGLPLEDLEITKTPEEMMPSTKKPKKSTTANMKLY